MEETIRWFAAGEVRLGQCILDKVKQNRQDKLEKKKDADAKQQAKQREAIKEASIVKLRMAAQNKEEKDLTIKDLRVLLKAVKRDGDPAIPSQKDKMLQWYEERKNRDTYIEPNVVENAEDEGGDDGGNGTDDEDGDGFFMEEQI